MRKSNAIKWEEFQADLNLLDEITVQKFEKVFIAEYIESTSSYALRDGSIGLNDFLKSLTRQELNIFLKLKGNFGKSYIEDKTFIEVLNHCLANTNPNNQRPILFAIDFIIDRHLKSRDWLIENSQIIEKIASSELEIKSLAISILKKLDSDYTPPVNKQYMIKPNQKFEFYKQFREIIKNAKGYIHIIDNYANHVVFDYIDAYCDLSIINRIKIITINNLGDLRLAKSNFESQYPRVLVEIKKSIDSNKSHDRYLLFDGEQWFLGPSIKDGGKGACTIVQLKDQAAQGAIDNFNAIWNTALDI